MSRIAFGRAMGRNGAYSRGLGRERGRANRRGQDKAPKVRAVGWGPRPQEFQWSCKHCALSAQLAFLDNALLRLSFRHSVSLT